MINKIQPDFSPASLKDNKKTPTRIPWGKSKNCILRHISSSLDELTARKYQKQPHQSGTSKIHNSDLFDLYGGQHLAVQVPCCSPFQVCRSWINSMQILEFYFLDRIFKLLRYDLNYVNSFANNSVFSFAGFKCGTLSSNWTSYQEEFTCYFFNKSALLITTQVDHMFFRISFNRVFICWNEFSDASICKWQYG